MNPHLGVDADTYYKQNERLIHHSIKMYRKVLHSRGIDYEDAFQEACIQFFKAYERFDPTKFENVTKFSTYAVPMMRGAIMRVLRDTQLVRFSRRIKHNFFRVVRENLLEEEPALIMKQLDLTEEEVKEVMIYFQNYSMYSLDTKLSTHDEDSDGDVYNLIPVNFMDETQFFLFYFMRTLPKNQQVILDMRLKDCVQSEIAATVGVSQVQISRTLKAIGQKAEKFLLGEEPTSPPAKKNVQKKERIAMPTAVKSRQQEEDQIIDLLTNTELSYKKISQQLGVGIRKVERLGLKHRPEEMRLKRRKSAPVGHPDFPVPSMGDRAKAAALIFEGKNYQEIAEITGVPIGSLSKVRDYAMKEKELGLPITGKPLPTSLKRQIKAEEKLKAEETKRTNHKKPSKTLVEVTLPPAPQPPKTEVVVDTPTLKNPYIDYEYEGEDVSKERFIQKLNQIIDMIQHTPPAKINYSIGINVKGE